MIAKQKSKQHVAMKGIIIVLIILLAGVLFVPYITKIITGMRDETHVKNEMSFVEPVIGSGGFITKYSKGSGTYLASRQLLIVTPEYRPALITNYYARPEITADEYIALYDRLLQYLEKRSQGHISKRPDFQMDLIRESWNKENTELPGAADFSACMNYMVETSAYHLCIEHFPKMYTHALLQSYQSVSDMKDLKYPYNMAVSIETMQKDDLRTEDLVKNTGFLQ